MKKGLCLVISILMIFGWAFAQEDEILNLKEKIIDLQNKGKLGFTNFTICSKIMGFASCVSLPEPVLDKNGTLLIYYEPINVFTNRKDELYEIWYTQDMTILKENGEVVSHWNDILTFHYTTQKLSWTCSHKTALNSRDNSLRENTNSRQRSRIN